MTLRKKTKSHNKVKEIQTQLKLVYAAFKSIIIARTQAERKKMNGKHISIVRN